ncbi:MAG: type I methionyl aminopeptidase [Anaerolineaceae bacterium 4572_78]|nr:MAG: type I methionyl aminopeptidase [Anaerolineaceae bacterium 4572_78]
MRKIRKPLPWSGKGKKRAEQSERKKRKTRSFWRKEDFDSKEIVMKTEAQIEGIRKSSQLTSKILDMVGERIQEGITTNEIDQWIYEYTVECDGWPATLNYKGFPKSTCTSINNVICHGIPDQTILMEGDIINVDVTTILNGYFGDASRMYIIGQTTPLAEKLVRITKECLYLGIEQVKPNAHIGNIGFIIQRYAQRHGFSVVRELVGHGTGVQFHEPPNIPHYGKRKQGLVLRPNMVFTIEPMINQGSREMETLSDEWTIVTKDSKLSAQWEHTVRVTETGVEILTK